MERQKELVTLQGVFREWRGKRSWLHWRGVQRLGGTCEGDLFFDTVLEMTNILETELKGIRLKMEQFMELDFDGK
mgnify:FL=1